ncbi:hypothetical protein Rhow_005899 [Rhodococcus wratislaviensis]|uniref:Uncharacterized protein n=1 Tax=Rhodococcus wratislaviensis TaxID=44752 RepID=A0A402BZX1_RHOWR|nr:hypothetical protein Rhow_005899 [Rhodococcus wratislaviensis]
MFEIIREVHSEVRHRRGPRHHHHLLTRPGRRVRIMRHLLM